MNDDPPDPTAANYQPQVFDVGDLEQARRIILTPEVGTTTEERWLTETPWLADRILEHFPLAENHLVIDFGCGVGRLAKALIARTGCWVIGVDMSASMRQLAPGYVGSAKFSVISPPVLDLLTARGVRAELALSIWVLQHVARPHDDIGRLQRVLVPGGGVFIANNKRRAVPTDRGWAHDGIDIDAMLAASFSPKWRGTLSREIGGDVLPDASFIAAYVKPG